VDVPGTRVKTSWTAQGFEPNLHVNTLLYQVKEGFVLYLDDDDIFVAPDSLEVIAEHLSSDQDLLISKTFIPTYGVQYAENLKQKTFLSPSCRTFKYDDAKGLVVPRRWPLGETIQWKQPGWPDAISKNFVHHINHKVMWKPVRGGDFQALAELWTKGLNVVHLDCITTAMQVGMNGGSRTDLHSCLSRRSR
jgi:hypothetical protein